MILSFILKTGEKSKMIKDNIVLIGMPGVGKSTVGVILAKILGYRFVDMDLVIQEEQKKLLKDIIEQEGVDGFITIEDDTNSRVNVNKTVIATGGSVVYGKKAMKHLGEIGTVVYLKTEYGVIEKRINNVKGRGVVLREGQTLKDIYDERTVLYEKYADITVDEAQKGVEETIEAIVLKLNKQINE